jgi:hypothetical protein
MENEQILNAYALDPGGAAQLVVGDQTQDLSGLVCLPRLTRSAIQ